MQINDWVDEDTPAKPVQLFMPKDEQERNAVIKDVFQPDEISDWVDEKPLQRPVESAQKPGAFRSALNDIGRNTLENVHDVATSTGEAISEPIISNPNEPGWLKPLDATVRTIGKVGNALGGVYGMVAAPVQGALTASVENSGVIPAAARSIKENLVPNDNRFTAEISPENQHQISKSIGGDLANAAFMASGGIQGKNYRDMKAGIEVKKPYNPITGTIAPVVQKAEIASQKLPGILGDTSEGVSANVALGGVPEYTSNRKAGLFSKDSQGLNDMSRALHEEAKPIYKAVDDAGGRINSTGIQNIKATIDEKLGSPDSLLDGPTLNLYSKMQKSMDSGDISVAKLENFRRTFSNIAEDTRKSKIDGGGLTQEGRQAVNVVRGIDSALKTMKPDHFSSGSPELISTLEQARATSARAMSFDKVARLVKKADGDPARIKTGLTRFLENDSNLHGLNDSEVAALREASKYSNMERIERGLGTFGIDLGIRKNVALAGAGGVAATTGAAPYVAPIIGAGTVTRQTSKLAARGKAQKALDTIASRPITKRLTDPVPPPVPKQLTYQPKPADIIVNEGGAARVSRPAEQAVMDVNRQRLQDIGLTPDVMKAQQQATASRLMEKYGQSELGKFVAENANRPISQKIFDLPETIYSQKQVDEMMRNSAWSKLESAEKARINADIEKAWREHKTSVADIILEARKRAEDLASAKGEKPKVGMVGEALLDAFNKK